MTEMGKEPDMNDTNLHSARAEAAAEQEKNERAQRYRDIVTQAYAHVQRGDLLGPPDDRPASDLDVVVEGVVGALRAEVRLYPELWAWIVSDQVRLTLLHDLDAVRAEAWDEGAEAARSEDFLADDFTPTQNPYRKAEQ